MMHQNDEKITTHTTEILQELEKQAMEKKLDVLLFSGNLTFNGDGKVLRKLKKA